MGKIKEILQNMKFRKKVVAIFSVVFAACFLLMLALQTFNMNRLRDKEAKSNLALLCEQTNINFSQEMSNHVQWLYNALSVHDIPYLIRKMGKDTDQRKIQGALGAMLQTTSPFDFLMLLTPENAYISETKGLAELPEEMEEARGLLKENDACGYGVPKWYCGADGDVYLIWDVYQTNPLIYCGKILAHMERDAMFTLGNQGKELEYIFLFYTLDGRFLYTTGLEETDECMELEQVKNAIKNDKIMIGGEEYFIVYYKNGLFRNVGLVPIKRIRESNIAALLMILPCGLLSLFGGSLLLTVCLYFMTKQLDIISEAMNTFASGKLDCRARVISKDDIGNIAREFNKMAERIGSLKESVAAEQRRKFKMEFELLKQHYRFLQAQLNPHFVFNALEAINAKAKMQGCPELCDEIILLSRYLRMVTTNMSREFMTVSQEFEGLCYYSDIFLHIYGKTLKIEYICQKEVEDAVLPVMVVQPVLENALVHGVRGMGEKKEIRVEGKAADRKRLQIIVSDSGCEYGKEKDTRTAAHEGIGLKNVKERLKMLYGSDAKIEIDGSEQGTYVIITLPLEYKAPLELENDFEFSYM